MLQIDCSCLQTSRWEIFHGFPLLDGKKKSAKRKHHSSLCCLLSSFIIQGYEINCVLSRVELAARAQISERGPWLISLRSPSLSLLVPSLSLSTGDDWVIFQALCLPPLSLEARRFCLLFSPRPFSWITTDALFIQLMTPHPGVYCKEEGKEKAH